jgi:hypothetical protein
MARAAVDGVKDDAVDWLATAAVDPPNSASAVSRQVVADLGDSIANDVADAVIKALRAEVRNDRRIELAGSHFFCDLLAATACAMIQFRAEFDQAIEYIVTEILNSQTERHLAVASKGAVELAAKIATKSIDKIIDRLPVGRHLDDVLRAVQMLAIMPCPAPEKHAEVIRCCIRPLGTPIISQEIQGRLRASLPAWMA